MSCLNQILHIREIYVYRKVQRICIMFTNIIFAAGTNAPISLNGKCYFLFNNCLKIIVLLN